MYFFLLFYPSCHVMIFAVSEENWIWRVTETNDAAVTMIFKNLEFKIIYWRPMP